MKKRSRGQRPGRERHTAKKTIAAAVFGMAVPWARSAWARTRVSWSAQRRALNFTFRFVACSGALSLAYAFPYEQGGAVHSAFADYLATYARIAGGLLSLLDATVHVEGANILGRFPMKIVKDCDAMEVNILLASAVLAFPARWWRRALGVAIGIFLLAVANLIRIAGLYLIGVGAPNAFEAAHRDLFPLLLVGVTALLFAAWARWAGEPGTELVHAVD
jgi:exosortase/archaeosortase family protein